MPDRRVHRRLHQDDEAVRIIDDWYRRLKDNRGDRASLRRAGDLNAVYFVPAYHSLYGELAAAGWANREGVAAIAAVLAPLDPEKQGGGPAKQGNKTFGRQLAEPVEGAKKARFSDLRFRRLLENRERREAVPALVRAVKMLGAAHLPSLADIAYHWDDQTRKDLAFEYYDHAPREEQ